jgi:hypothetical protein
MPRESAIELANGKGKRQRAWEAIRAKKGGEWTRTMIARDACIELSGFDCYLKGLVASGTVRVSRTEKVQGNGGAAALTNWHVLVKDCGVEAPRLRQDGSEVTIGRAQEQMWRALRMLKGDTNSVELAAHASTAEIPVAVAAARFYLFALNRAGYLEVTEPCCKRATATQRAKLARYRLKASRNTGPKPPMLCRTSAVFDANENRVVWTAPMTEEDVIYAR